MDAWRGKTRRKGRKRKKFGDETIDSGDSRRNEFVPLEPVTDNNINSVSVDIQISGELAVDKNETESKPVTGDPLTDSANKTSLFEESLHSSVSENHTIPRKRKIHLNNFECHSLSQSNLGAKTLTKPFEVPKSNRDPNRRLQPRLRRQSKRYSHPRVTQTSAPAGKDHINNEDDFLKQERVTKHNEHNEVPFDTTSQHDGNGIEHEVKALSSCLTVSSQPVGFCKASSLIFQTEEDITDCDIDKIFRRSSSQPSHSSFTSASSLLGLTDSQIEVGGFRSTKTAANKTFQRNNNKLQRAKETAGPYQKDISNFFTKSTIQSTSPRKVKMESQENIDEENAGFVQVTYRSPSKMYSPLKQVSDAIYISDSTPDSSPAKSQEHYQKHKLNENVVVKKLFEGQRNLAAGQPGPKKRRQNSHSQSSWLKHNSVNDKKEKHSQGSSSESKTTNHDDGEMQKMYKQTYGLVGQGSSSSFADVSSDQCTINYFEVLPIHLIEHIFSQLPILDLCLNSNRVCTQWNNIISDDKFVPWKKKYHRLKASNGSLLPEISKIMTEAEMTNPSKYLKGLIRYMKDLKPVTALNMTDCLSSHPKFDWATALIKERVPECIEHEEANPWSVIAALVIISDSVADIQAILTCLTVSRSQCTSMEVLECLYCLATLLYAFRLKAGPDVWSGMHYRVFYALYLYENSCVSNHGMLQDAIPTSTAGQQTIVKYSRGDTVVRLTHEQMRIIKHTPNDGDVVKIVAFAGTGKTTTLVRYTQMRPDKKFLLVVYNKSVREHAMTKFPKNVTCKTGHALAFASTGRRYVARNKLRNLKVYDITQVLPPRKGDNLYVRAKFVMETVNTFCSSADDQITSAHVPDTRKDDQGNKICIDHAAKMRYAEDGEYLWRRMKDYEDMRVGMSHDGYLKMYQLYKPHLSEYDIILIDEAQDLTPAVIDILMNQNQAKILVGDPHQQIYSFRGAVNAMREIPSSHTFYLTQSFRFGPEIAHVAASCLEVFKNVKEKTIVGHGEPGQIRGEKIGQIAIISRLNFTVFSEAAKKCCYCQEEYKVAFVGGTDAFGFPMILDIYTLMMSEEDRKKETRQIQNKLIKGFRDMASLEKYAIQVADTELLGKIRIVRTFHHNIPMTVKKILSKCVRDLTQADIVFSTAHKAKGLEFSTVQVTDDFVNVQNAGLDIGVIGFQDIMNAIQIPADETNLLYVAVTRAKNALLMSPTLLRVLKDNGEQFEYPVSSQHLEKTCVPFKCFQTDVEFKPQALTLRKLDVTLGEGEPKAGGLYGPVILSEDIHRFAELLGDPSVKPVTKQKPRFAVNNNMFGFNMFNMADSDDDDGDLIPYPF